MSNQIEPGKLHGAKKWARETLGRGLVQPPIEYCDAAAEVIQSLPDTVVDGDKLREVIADWGNREVTSDAYTLYRQVLALLPTLPKKTMEGVKWDGRKHHLAEAVADWIDIEPYEVVMIEPGSGASNIKVWNPRMNEYRNVDSSALIPTGRKYKLSPDNSEEIVKAIRYEKELCLDSQDFSRAKLWRDMERAAGQGEWKDLLDSIRELKLPKDSDSTSVNGAVTRDSPLSERMDSLFGYDPTGKGLPEYVPAGEPWIVKHDGHEWVGTRESRVETVCSWALARLDGADYTVARDDEITLVSRLVPEVGA